MPAITHVRTVLNDADEAYDFIEHAQIAAAAGCSPRQQRAAFLARWGMPPMRHMREIRLDLARCELDSPELEGTPVAEVARRSGFAHTAGFRAALHRRYGQDPAHRMRPRGRRVP